MRSKGIIITLVSLLVLAYLYLGYGVDRNAFPYHLWLLLFALTYLLFHFQNQCSEKLFWGLSIGLRLLLLFSIPLLTDDYYRFFWDGTLGVLGESPYAYLPSEVLQLDIKGLDNTLYDSLNSPEYYSVYPPFCQWLFQCSAWCFPDSISAAVIVMKIPLVFADLGSIYLLRKLLPLWQQPSNRAWIYALNPLVIIEFSGNLHLEAFLIFFLLAAIWFWKKQKPLISGGMMALGIGAKLLPILFLPLFVFQGDMRKRRLFFSAVICAGILLFYPLFQKMEYLRHFMESVDLYFHSFEFNASFYYILREIGYWIKGYNMISLIGTLSSVFILCITVFLSWKKRYWEIPRLMLVTLGIYLFLSSIVHPWYVLPLLPLSLLIGKSYFAIFWTLLAPLSYLGYSTNGYEESSILLIIEYGLIFGILIWEWLNKKQAV